MSIDLDILEDDLAAMIDDMPVTATIGSKSVSCRQSTLAEVDRAAAAGEMEDYTFSLHTVISDYDTLPELGDLVTVDEVEYRILRIVSDPVGMRLDCGAKYSDRTQAR